MSSKHNNFPIPKHYQNQSALSKCHPKAIEFLRKWDGKSGCALFGPTGVGKSLSVGIACMRVNAQNTGTWCKWVRADHLTRMVNERSSGEQIQELKNARILVIDEMGYEPWPTQVLEVLGDRHDNERPSLITCGLSQSAFPERYADATLRRIVEIGNGLVVDFWGEMKAVVNQ